MLSHAAIDEVVDLIKMVGDKMISDAFAALVASKEACGYDDHSDFLASLTCA